MSDWMGNVWPVGASAPHLPDFEKGAAVLLAAVKLCKGLNPEMNIGQTVLTIAQQTTVERLTPILQSALEQCEDRVRKDVFRFIDQINGHVGKREFWRREVDDVFVREAGFYAMDVWKREKYGTNTELFSKFQALMHFSCVFNLVLAVLADGGRKAFVQKSIGTGVLGRLFG